MALGWRGQYLRYREFFLNITDLYKKRADLRAFLEVVLSLTAITIFLLFALKPTALTIISLLKEIKEKQVTVTGLDEKISNLQTAQSVFATYQSVIPGIDKAVGTLAMPNVISNQTTGLATRDSIEILGISIGQVTLVGNVPFKKSSSEFKPLPESASEMPISISIKGSYANIMTFAKDFENLRIPVKIDNFAINASSTEKGKIIVAVLSGRVPFLGEKQPKPNEKQ